MYIALLAGDRKDIFMALYKKTTSDNGITYTYHRIVSLTNITNVQGVVEVCSYLKQSDREEEISLFENPQEDQWFTKMTSTKSYLVDYDENMSIPRAYEYLKTLEEFKNAKDVLEDGQEVVSD